MSCRAAEPAVMPATLYQHLLLMAEKKFWRCVEAPSPLQCRAPAGPH